LREAVAASRNNPAPKVKDAAKKPEENVAKKAADAIGTVEPDIQTLIRSAYLRTLSRPPTAEEEQRIRRHLGATGKVEGMRDVIWALVNSKEFIVNH
jgi:hypothetical protein